MIETTPEILDEARQLRDNHRSYEDIARIMAARHGVVLSRDTWRIRLDGRQRGPRQTFTEPVTFAQAYRAALAEGIDLLEMGDPMYECKGCGGLVCECEVAA